MPRSSSEWACMVRSRPCRERARLTLTANAAAAASAARAAPQAAHLSCSLAPLVPTHPPTHPPTHAPTHPHPELFISKLDPAGSDEDDEEGAPHKKKKRGGFSLDHRPNWLHVDSLQHLEHNTGAVRGDGRLRVVLPALLIPLRCLRGTEERGSRLKRFCPDLWCITTTFQVVVMVMCVNIFENSKARKLSRVIAGCSRVHPPCAHGLLLAAGAALPRPIVYSRGMSRCRFSASLPDSPRRKSSRPSRFSSCTWGRPPSSARWCAAHQRQARRTPHGLQQLSGAIKPPAPPSLRRFLPSAAALQPHAL